MRKFPKAGFRPVPVDLFNVLHFLPEAEMCVALGVNAFAFRRWLDGEEPVPKIAYLFAKCIAGQELPRGFGPFADARLENGRLYAKGKAGKTAGLAFAELSLIEHMRAAIDDLEGLNSQVRRLQKERDFYKAQLNREIKFGMIVNDLFDH